MEPQTYARAYERSIAKPRTFWREAAQQIDWFEFPTSILDKDDNGADRWFRGGKLNTAWLALDRHVAAGRGDDVSADLRLARHRTGPAPSRSGN